MAKRRAVLERIAGASGLGLAVGLAGCGSTGGTETGDGSAASSGEDGTASGTGDGSDSDDGSGSDAGGDSDDGSGSEGESASVSASGPTVKGVVKGKRLVGDGEEPFVGMNATTVTAADSDYEGRFERGNFTVGDGLADEMESKHGDVRYYVVIRLTTEDPSAGAETDDRVAYVASRESFNAVRLGEKVWFRTGGGDGDEPHVTEFIAQ